MGSGSSKRKDKEPLAREAPTEVATASTLADAPKAADESKDSAAVAQLSTENSAAFNFAAVVAKDAAKDMAASLDYLPAVAKNAAAKDMDASVQTGQAVFLAVVPGPATDQQPPLKPAAAAGGAEAARAEAAAEAEAAEAAAEAAAAIATDCRAVLNSGPEPELAEIEEALAATSVESPVKAPPPRQVGRSAVAAGAGAGGPAALAPMGDAVRFTSTFAKDYEVGEVLGAGVFGEVYAARRVLVDPLGMIPIGPVAVKVVEKANVEDMRDLEREIALMARLSDTRTVLLLFEVADEPERMRLVLERMAGGDLFDAILDKGTFTEQDASRVMYQLCEALSHLHDRRIVHRDVKADNLLLASKAEDSAVKLADFGVAREWPPDGQRMMTACGTPFYVAPEVVVGDGYIGGASDCWSAGVILFMMLCGYPPFAEEDMPTLFALIMTGTYAFDADSKATVSVEAQQVVQRLLDVSPATRLTAADSLSCPWMQSAAPDAHLNVAAALTKTHRLRKAGHRAMTLQRAGLLLEFH